MDLTSKQRSYLMSLANTLDPIVQIGKNGVNTEVVNAAEDAFRTHELIKVGVLKNAPVLPQEAAELLSTRTHSTNVKVIGRKFILYKPDREDPQIILPKTRS